MGGGAVNEFGFTFQFRTHQADTCFSQTLASEETLSPHLSSARKRPQNLGAHYALQSCSCDGLVAGYLALGAAGNLGLTCPPQNPDGWTAPPRIQGVNGTVPQKPWEMWGLPKRRTQGPGGVLGLLHNQAGNPKLSN